MSEDPKRLLDDPTTADPELAARLRSDLRIAKDSPPGYDVESGLARLSATIAGGSPGGGQGGGSGPGAKGAASGAGHLAGSSAASAVGAKVGLLGLVALGALGGALVVGSAAKPPPSASEAATIALPASITPSAPSIEAPPPDAPRSAEQTGAHPSAGAPADGPRGAASAATAASSTVKPEMAQLIEARRALASDPGRALALAEDGHARFPRGVFWQEREAAAISALSKLGRSGEAKARARMFVAKHPESPFAEGFRSLSEGD